MNRSASLYLTAHAQAIVGTANCGAELLDAIPWIDERLVEIGWRVSLPDESGDVQASSSLCCFSFAADEGDARRSIIRLSRLLDVHAGQLRLLNCLIQAWEGAERMDTICGGLTVRWSRKDALSLAGEAHPKVVRLRPYGALSGGGR